jgi:hypothetical protein
LPFRIPRFSSGASSDTVSALFMEARHDCFVAFPVIAQPRKFSSGPCRRVATVTA